MHVPARRRSGSPASSFSGCLWDSKALWHAELEETRPSTRNKLRTNLFLALRQSGMLADDATIISPLLSAEVSALLDARTPSDRRFFPVGGGL